MQSDFLSSQHFVLQFHRIQRYMIYKYSYTIEHMIWCASPYCVWLRKTPSSPSPPHLFLFFAVCSHWDDATIYLDKLCNWLCYCFVALAAIIGQTARTDCKLHFGKAATVAFPRIKATGNFGWKLPASATAGATSCGAQHSTAVGAVLWHLSV